MKDFSEQKIERLITVGVYLMPYEADIVRSLLEAYDIQVFPVDYNIIYIKWLYANALGWIKLRVSEEDAAEAREIIAFIPVPSSSPFGGEGGVRGNFNDSELLSQPDLCPHCGGSDTYPIVRGRMAAMITWIVTGWPLVWPWTRLRCSSCGHIWRA